jgi:hypothetical protein
LLDAAPNTRIAGLCVIALVAVIFGGCGDEAGERGASDREATTVMESLDATEVRAAFKDITGDELELREFPEDLRGIIPRVDYLSSSRIEYLADGTPEVRPASGALEEKYGEFLIAVYETDVPKRVTESAGPEDVRGIRWRELHAEVGPQQGDYVAAEKVYGRNIVLRWYPDTRRKETDAQWERLDAALSALVRR